MSYESSGGEELIDFPQFCALVKERDLMGEMTVLQLRSKFRGLGGLGGRGGLDGRRVFRTRQHDEREQQEGAHHAAQRCVVQRNRNRCESHAERAEVTCTCQRRYYILRRTWYSAVASMYHDTSTT